MFAVLKTGGKQYKVSKSDVVIVEKLSAVAGDIIQFDHVLMISDGKIQVGTPIVSGAAVHGEVIEQAKNKKVTSFVKRRRKHSSQRTRGHRQNVTVLRISDIIASGAKTVGTQIEVGAKIVGSNPLAVKKPVVKAEVVKKPAVKTETTSKPEESTKAAKKPALKTESAKKQVAKVEGTKKPEAKAKPTKKPEAKVEPTKKPAAKATVAKKPAAKASGAKKPVTKS
jgi:large subunit ribosomal protein L21